MKTLWFIAMVLLFASCATVVNKKSYNLIVKTNNSNDRVVFKDSSYEVPALLRVTRSRADLQLTIVRDSTIHKDITIKSGLDAHFLFGNLAFMTGSPAGYLVDLTTQKRFTYGKAYDIMDDDTVRILRAPVENYFYTAVRKQLDHPTKGRINFIISMPYANAFYFHPPGQSRKSKVGFFGISQGAEYFYSRKHSTRFMVGFVADFPVPFPAPYDAIGKMESQRSLFISVTNRVRINRLILGYGIHYSANYWQVEYIPEFSSDPQLPTLHGTNYNFGVNGSVHWQVTKAFALGILYNPSLLTVRPTTKLEYQHFISLEIAFQFPLNKTH